MSEINKLIHQYCPNGVEYLRLEDNVEIRRGERVTKRDISSEGEYPVISGGVSPLGYMPKTNRTKNTITIAYVDLQKKDFWANDVCLCLYPNEKLLNKFLYYILKFNQNYLYSKTTKAIPDHIPTKIIKDLMIPIPPIEVQNKIVDILDSFTTLEAELEAELEARKKQYAYYREKLYDFSNRDDVEWHTLGELGSITRGNNIQKTDFLDEGFPCIHYGQIYTYYHTLVSKTLKYISNDRAKKAPKAHPGDNIITLTSENMDDVCTPVAWLGDTDVAVSAHAVIYSHNQNPRYIAYYFKTKHFYNEKRKYARGAKVIEMKPEDLSKIKIPVPPLEEQEKIASVIDKFEALMYDMKGGLSGEIAARHKLLTFKRKEA